MREQPQKVKKILEAEPPDVGRTLRQRRQNTDIENSAEVLEEIWHRADREFPTSNLGSCARLFRKIRPALVGLKEDTFGACLCCRRMIGLKRLKASPWTPLCIRCQEAADRNDTEILRSRSRG